MKQIVDTLAQLQRLRDKSVQDIKVRLAKQQRLCASYDNNIRALGSLLQKTSAGGAAPSAASLKNVAGYKGSLRQVIAWQEQEKTLAKIKEGRIQKNLIAAACQEKIVNMTLENQQQELRQQRESRQQKAMDEVAIQCWLRQNLPGAGK